MTSPRMRALALSFLITIAAGCVTLGDNFPSASIAKIEKGVSTKKQVRRSFGEPFRTGVDNGFESWTYVYNRWTPFGKTRSKDLYIVFNKDGTVRAYTFNSNLDGKDSAESEGGEEE